MITCELERLALQYDESFHINHMILSKCNNLITKWELPNKKDYIIITNSTKKPNYKQLTYFSSDIPQYDLQRDNLKDLAHELTLLDATIGIINYIS